MPRSIWSLEGYSALQWGFLLPSPVLSASAQVQKQSTLFRELGPAGQPLALSPGSASARGYSCWGSTALLPRAAPWLGFAFLPLFRNSAVAICWGCPGKAPQTGWFILKESYYLPIWAGWVPPLSCEGRTCLRPLSQLLVASGDPWLIGDALPVSLCLSSSGSMYPFTRSPVKLDWDPL